MNIQVVKWCVDLLMGVTFLTSFSTGIFKFTLLMRMLGLRSVVLPMAFLSDIHDWSGIALGCCVALHLVLNRGWIIAMTRKMIGGSRASR